MLPIEYFLVAAIQLSHVIAISDSHFSRLISRYDVTYMRL